MAKRPDLTQAEIDRVVAMYKSGLSINRTAAILGFSETSVARWLKRRGIELRPQSCYPRSKRSYDVTDAEILAMCEMAHDGKKISEIAEAMGRCEASIICHLNKAGIKKRFTFDKHIDAIRSRYEAGESGNEIAASLGIKITALYAMMRRFGIPIREMSAAKKGRPNPKGRAFTPEQEQEVCRRYMAGESQSAIARYFGVSPCSVQRCREDHNLPIQPRQYTTSFSTRSLIYTSPHGRRCTFRSSWEIEFAKKLDQDGIDWAYESHSFLLSDGGYFIPDFWVPDWNVFIEIKGYMREDAAVKLAMFRREYPDRPIILATRGVLHLYGLQIVKGGKLKLVA